MQQSFIHGNLNILGNYDQKKNCFKHSNIYCHTVRTFSVIATKLDMGVGTSCFLGQHLGFQGSCMEAKRFPLSTGTHPPNDTITNHAILITCTDITIYLSNVCTEVSCIVQTLQFTELKI